MTDDVAAVETPPWWERTPRGQRLLLGFVKIDRKGSTDEWSDLPADEVARRRVRFTDSVESIARTANAAQPLHWQGDGVMLFLAGDETEPAVVRALRAAKLLWERVRVDLNLSVRIAVHAAHVAWDPDTGKLAHPAIDHCGHLEQAAPENSIVVTEDVYLALPAGEQRNFALLGVSRRDSVPAYVMPVAAAERRQGDAFVGGRELDVWEAFRRYARSTEIRKLRYVGLRLTKKEPPALDVETVFVPPEVQVRERAQATLRERVINTVERGAGAPARRGDTLGDAPFTRWEERSETRPPQPFRSVFQDTRGLVVLGDPGSGKTTLLRWLAVVAAGGRLEMVRELGVDERLLPLPVSVGALAGVRAELGATCSVPEAMARYFHGRNVEEEGELRKFLVERLKGGDCLVLLDGLDEVRSAAERDEIRLWLESFAAGYPRNRFVVSSRHVGFPGFLLGDGAVVELRSFDEAQVGQYVRAFAAAYRKWETGSDDPTAARREAEQLLEALKGNPRLGGLARNPFMLSALALINRAEGRLPRHRVQFYSIFARALCETWGAARRIVARESERTLPFEEEAIPILGELAYRMHESYPTGAAPEEVVRVTLADALRERRGVPESQAEEVAATFLERAGREVQILLERGAGTWGFLHLTFQEFFVAAGLHASERFNEEGLKHLLDPRWEEILRLGVGYLALVQNRPEAARRFVMQVLSYREKGARAPLSGILRQHEAMAALFAAEAGDALPEDLQREVAERLARWALDMPRSISARVLDDVALTEFREAVALPLVSALKDKDGMVRGAAAQALGALRAEAAIGPLVRFARGRSRGDAERDAAVGALVQIAESPRAPRIALPRADTQGARTRTRRMRPRRRRRSPGARG